MEEILSTRLWAIESGFFNSMSPIVLSRIENGKDLSIFQPKTEAKSEDTPAIHIEAGIIGKWDREENLFVYEEEDTGKRIAEIQMIGTLSKHGGMCTPGSRQMINQINKANASKRIDGIVLVADGPGGSVSGTTELGQAIKGSKKPVVAFVDEMAASAHYWAVSQADYIVANESEYTQVGSIGVLCMMVNQREWLAKEGLEVKIMRADQSVDKALLNSVEEWPEESLKELQEELNMMAEHFKATVKEGRGDRLSIDDEDIFTGKMYDADKALKLGMIDFKGDLAGAINWAGQLSEARKVATN